MNAPLCRREVQRILMELLTQMDGFEQSTNVKVGARLGARVLGRLRGWGAGAPGAAVVVGATPAGGALLCPPPPFLVRFCV